MTPMLLQKARRSVRFAGILAGTAFMLLAVNTARIQAQSPDHAPPQAQGPEHAPLPETGRVQTYFLKNITDFHQLEDIQTNLRNMLNRARIYGTASENAITIRGTEEELATAQKLIAEFDRPIPIYRVTYTITDMDGGKRTGSHSISVLVREDSRGTLKLGTRVPIMTGSTKSGADNNTQIQYVDVGLTVEASASGSELRTKLEQTGVSAERSNVGIQDPVINQTTVEGTSPLTDPKPVVLGTIDVPNSARQQQITVSVELVSGNPQ